MSVDDTVRLDLSEFRARICIDPEALDVGALEQSGLFFDWASRAAEGRATMEQEKHNLDILTSKMSLKCRRSPDEFGLSKVTESAITDAINATQEYRQQLLKYLNAREESLYLDACVEALAQRKRMIEILVSLHGQSYFATPAIGRNLIEAWQGQQKRLAEKQKGLMKRRKAANKDKVTATSDEEMEF